MMDSERYASSVNNSLLDNSKSIGIFDRKNYELAKKMWDVVVKERALAEREKEERRQLKGKESGRD